LEASLFPIIGESKVGIHCLAAEFRVGVGRVDVDFAVATDSGVSLTREEEGGGGDGSDLHHGCVMIYSFEGKLCDGTNGKGCWVPGLR